MGLPTEKHELLAAWRALSGSSTAEGWRTIPVGLGGPCRLLAGRRFPGNEETLLVAIQFESAPQADQLPQGQGFHLFQAHLSEQQTSESWIALCRHPNGRLDIFAMMAADIISTLANLTTGDTRIVPAFLGRIRAWQQFMRNTAGGTLGLENELGLVGELEVMRTLILSGLPASIAVQAWQGPLGGLHDYAIGNGAIEVKSTSAQEGFPAKIYSLDQLDDSIVYPLFLSAVRLVLEDTGKSLPMLVSEVRRMLVDDEITSIRFESALLHTGYSDSMAEEYTRLFRSVEICIFPVSEGFPRLTRGSVPFGIRSARYEIDLDSFTLESVTFIEALRRLEVQKNGIN